MVQPFGIGRARTVALVVVGTLIGASVLAPTVGWAAKFLTKKKADKRYVNTKEVVAAGNTIDTGIDEFAQEEFSSLVSAPISAPAGGTLILVGQVGAAAEEMESPELSLRLRVDGTPVTGGDDSGQGFGGENFQTTMGLTAAVRVDPGPHTVHVDGRIEGIGGPVDIRGRSLSVLFVPNAGGVSIPA
jgi:hypothetical protein